MKEYKIYTHLETFLSCNIIYMNSFKRLPYESSKPQLLRKDNKEKGMRERERDTSFTGCNSAEFLKSSASGFIGHPSLKHLSDLGKHRLRHY